MKITARKKSKFRFLVGIMMMLAVVFTFANMGAKQVVFAENETSASSDENKDKDTGKKDNDNEKETSSSQSILSGNANEIKLTDVFTQAAGYNGQAGIHFKAQLDEEYIKNADSVTKSDTNDGVIYAKPVVNSSDPFVIDACYYQIAYPVDDNKFIDAGFVFNVKGDVKTGYFPITFEIQYNKNGQTYTVNKTVDITVYGKEEESTSDTVSVPRIIVTGYETNPEKVMAGEQFELTVHLKNTSNKTAVSNIKITLGSAGNEFLPVSGSSTTFVRSMSCGATTDIVMMMKAQSSLEQKPYVLSVKCEYEGEKNAAYTADENISIPVYQEAKAKITDVDVSPMSIETFGQANVMFSINNTGKSTLYNVQVGVDPDCKSVQSDDSFVGNIAPGSTGYADFMVNGVAPTEDDGKVKIIISYEDASGNLGTFETEANIFVYEPMVDDMMVGDDFDPGFYEEPAKQSFPWIYVIAGIVVVIVVVVTIVVINKKKKKAMEEELEDEIS